MWVTSLKIRDYKKEEGIAFQFIVTLDRVGYRQNPPPPSCATFSNTKKLHVICDTWCGVNILLKFQKPSSYRLEDWEEKDYWMNELIR